MYPAERKAPGFSRRKTRESLFGTGIAEKCQSKTNVLDLIGEVFMVKQIEHINASVEEQAFNDNIVTIETVRELCGVAEETGYEAPFLTFTWEHWQNWQARILQNMSSFQRAIQGQHPHQAALISLEIQELALEIQKEACAWLWPDPGQKTSSR